MFDCGGVDCVKFIVLLGVWEVFIGVYENMGVSVDCVLVEIFRSYVNVGFFGGD